MTEITDLYAWIVDDPTHSHGIIGFRMQNGVEMQCVSSKRAIVEKLKPHAIRVARMTGLPVRLQHFKLAETLDEA